MRDLFEAGTEEWHLVLFSLMRLMPSVRAVIHSYGGGNDEREQTLNQLLAEMDGFDTNKGLVASGSHEPSGGFGSGTVKTGTF